MSRYLKHDLSSMNLLLGCTVFICLLILNTESLERKVDTIFWPNCEDFNKSCAIAKLLGDNVVYSKASSSSHDNLHYVFSTLGVPSIAITHTTGNDADLYFNWDMLMNGTLEDAITFKDTTNGFKVEYKYAAAFTKLIEFNDTNDNADLNDPDLKVENWKISDFRYVFWDKLPDESDKTNTIIFNTTDDFITPNMSNNGSLSFTFQVYGKDGRASELPSLLYSANETLFDFVLANYTPSFSQSRFALEVVVVSLSNNKEMSIDTTQTIDDEYSPGVFQLNTWLSNPDHPSSSGFIQWKPVCYLSSDRDRSSATKVKHYDLQEVSQGSLEELEVNSSIAQAFFPDLWAHGVILRASNISFGLSKDGYYLKNNYTAWSAAVGFGDPPVDKISTTLIIIISAGLGIPVLLIIFGGIYTIVKRLKATTGYEPVRGTSINQVN